jgi:hypothetical protein
LLGQGAGVEDGARRGLLGRGAGVEDGVAALLRRGSSASGGGAQA